MDLMTRIAQAADFIRNRAPAVSPRVGIVFGTGLSSLRSDIEDAVSVPYQDIPHFVTSTVESHPGELVLGRLEDQPIVAMRGRFHAYEGYDQDQVTFPVRVMKALGVETLVVSNACGGLNPQWSRGDIMLIEDHINLMGGNPLVGPNEEQLGPRFFDMTEAYDPKLREIAEKACWKAGVTVRRGVYIAVTGPSYETPAEIRMARTMGADAVGMSTVPEVVAARHMGIRVLGISCITNMASGVIKKKLDHREVLEVGERVKGALGDVLGRIVQEAAKLA
jgi:purine-nucleoside phosphorylase